MSGPDGPGADDPITRLYLAQRPSLRRFVARILGRSEDVEDVLQETFERAFRSGAAADAESPKAYLYAVARNLAFDVRARRQRRVLSYMEDSPPETVISHEPPVDDQVHQRLRLEAFWRAVETLPPQCRSAFLLRKVHGLTHKEIAKRLSISLSTVEKHLAKGLQRCAAQLRAEGFEDGSAGARANDARRRTNE